MLRHTEGRYEVHRPDETSVTFDYVTKLVDGQPSSGRLPPEQGLVLIAPFDGIGGARRSLEILGVVPALYIGIENDESCTLVVKGAWPEAITLQNVNEVTEEVL